MFNALQTEIFKTKRTIIRYLLWIFPILVVILTALIFAPVGYVAQSIINQWSFFWVNLFLALIIGLVDRHEKRSTEYKMILSSPSNLFSYELGRIAHGVVLLFVVSLVLSIWVILAGFVFTSNISIQSYCLAILGLFLVNIWEVPLYTWLSRISNLYVSIAVSFVGSEVGVWICTLPFGKFFPFAWSAVFPVSLIKIHVNGIPLKIGEGLPNNNWTIFASIILFVILSYLAALSFKKQVIKDV